MYESDVVALVSKLEGLPNTVCEGMALGKPIIMTRVFRYIKIDR
jgi:glycosyltransferase involved in cell wall biosynthesis